MNKLKNQHLSRKVWDILIKEWVADDNIFNNMSLNEWMEEVHRIKIPQDTTSDLYFETEEDEIIFNLKYSNV
jgi:hypothetical protein